MKARFMRGLGRHQTHAAHDFHARRDASDDRVSGKAAVLRYSKDRRHDDGARMDGAAFKGVVIILTMRGGAVDQRRIVGTVGIRVPYGGDRAFGRRAAARGGNVIQLPRGDAEAGHVNHQQTDDFSCPLRQ